MCLESFKIDGVCIDINWDSDDFEFSPQTMCLGEF